MTDGDGSNGILAQSIGGGGGNGGFSIGRLQPRRRSGAQRRRLRRQRRQRRCARQRHASTQQRRRSPAPRRSMTRVGPTASSRSRSAAAAATAGSRSARVVQRTARGVARLGRRLRRPAAARPAPSAVDELQQHLRPRAYQSNAISRNRSAGAAATAASRRRLQRGNDIRRLRSVGGFGRRRRQCGTS